MAEVVEYESDPEEAKLSLKLRRREASDDEDEGGGGDEREERREKPEGVDSEGESDGQGAVAEYYDDEEEEYDEYEEEEEEESVERAVEEAGAEVEAAAVVAEAAVVAAEAVTEAADEPLEVEEEKKENEPSAVPTAGAFYMHDDRFRDNAGGRNRRTLGDRKLWASKDEMKWGHDKFEEITSQERHYEQGRRNSRGRGKYQGVDRGNQRGNRAKAYNNNNQNEAPKAVRGRGPRRYVPSFRRNDEAPPKKNIQSGKSVEKTSHPSSGRSHGPTSKIEHTGKQVSASILSSASPPFYPSGSSTKDISMTQKKDRRVENFPMSQSNSVLRGNDFAEKLYIDDSQSPVSRKLSTNYQLPSSGSSFKPTVPHNQINRVSPPNPINTVHRSSVQTRKVAPGSGSRVCSPPKAGVVLSSFEPGEVESPVDGDEPKDALVGKVKEGVQGSGRGSFLYSAAQIMSASGNLGGGHGDQNFSPTPAFLPVMQFGNQHPGGRGVPAMGMAFPGYVGQPQLGMGNSEMTWLPVLAGAGGSLGATYPYIAIDGAYHARPPAQASSSDSSSKETNASKPTDEWKPPQTSELPSDELGQRQSNARRYSKMNFSQ